MLNVSWCVCLRFPSLYEAWTLSVAKYSSRLWITGMLAVGASRQRCSQHNLDVLILKVRRADGKPPQCQCAGGLHHADAATLYGS